MEPLTPTPPPPPPTTTTTTTTTTTGEKGWVGDWETTERTTPVFYSSFDICSSQLIISFIMWAFKSRRPCYYYVIYIARKTDSLPRGLKKLRRNRNRY